ncbi:MAG: FAD binding domain-containing protein [Planctomycetota bacterium]|jgi:xanthine dehydrogenase YagS FAD-binding subunit
MKRFAYLDAETFAAASGALAESGGSVAKSGGTDLLDLLKERILEPSEVVNLGRARRDEKKGEISALATLAEVAEDQWVKVDFPALHHAAAVAATPQIRNVGTVGGNLCQHTRCWYFRNKSFECFKRGTGDCSAVREGAQNRYHAIFPHDRCASAYPGNLAPALIALGARVACVHPDGDRVMDVELLYEEPAKGKAADTVLRDGELIRAVLLQRSAMTRRSIYREFRERLSFDFAAASVAVALDLRDGVVKEARIVCGGVAPTPFRARAAEKALLGNGVDAAGAADAAVADALPLEQNGYKVPILRTLIRQALEELKS